MTWHRYPTVAGSLLDPSGQRIGPAEIEVTAAQLDALPAQGLAFLFNDQSLESVRRFAALLLARRAVLLLDARTSPAVAAELVACYRPELVLLPQDGSPIQAALSGYDHRPAGWSWSSGPQRPVHPELSVLLTTSGSTGSPKLVRLSYRNVASNAEAIASSLGLVAADRVVTSLPLHYSFGMSLVTSHLAVGSSVLVSAKSVLDRTFWSDIDKYQVTHFAGVPQTYAMLKRIGFSGMQLPSLKALLQAGGRLNRELVAEFHADSVARGRRFFVMYGQTEAGPRMACLPPNRLGEKLGSAGVAIPGGQFTIVDQAGVPVPAGQTGEVTYTGPNVMMGYAQSRADLALGDQLGGTLATGDLGTLDDEGFLFLTGRTKRIAKLAGVRVSLDDVEEMVSDLVPVAAVAAPEEGIVIFTSAPNRDLKAATKRLARQLGTPPTLLTVREVAHLPELPSGKIDYKRLTEMAAAKEGSHG